MARYTIVHSDGKVISYKHKTPLGALRQARKLCWDLGPLTISEYPTQAARTGRTVMHVSVENETDWQHRPLDFWKNGQPII